MSAPTLMQRAQAFLAERRRSGFQARSTGYALISFARHMDQQPQRGQLSGPPRPDWARRDKCQRSAPQTWARRLKLLRPFARWLRQFEPRTAVPDESITAVLGSNWRNQRAKGRRSFSRRAQVCGALRWHLSRRAQSGLGGPDNWPRWGC